MVKIDSLISQSRYICCFKGIVDDFEKEQIKLMVKRETIKKEVQDAIRSDKSLDGVTIKDAVADWLRRSKELVEDDTEATRACLWVLCPNCIWRYRRGKKLAQKTHDIRALVEAANFSHVVQDSNLPALKSLSDRDFIHFESRSLIYKQLLEALEDDNYMTGLCGMMGIGKTTLAKEVGAKLLETRKFDHVIFIQVYDDLSIQRIQDDIANQLGMMLSDEIEFYRALRLRMKLMMGSKILITFDGVCDHINFEQIGIPSGDNHMNCRVLVTSIHKRLCESMGCSRLIQLERLSEQEACVLFQKHAGINDNSAIEYQERGHILTKECDGIPEAIVKIAMWKGQPRTRFYETEDVIYSKFIDSYKRMKSKAAQKLFLLLSVFPKDTEIPIETLTRFGIGMGLLEDVDEFSYARYGVLKAKDILIDSSLLLETKGGLVKMHGFFRKMALWEAKEQIQVIKLSDVNQTAVTSKRKNIRYVHYDDLEVEAMDFSPNWSYAITQNGLDRKRKNIRYLYCDDMQVRDMDIFPSWFDGTKLEILLINIEASDYVEVPISFFEKMTSLRVLSLSSNSPQLKLTLLLPFSGQSLTNIRSVFLNHWKLGDISCLGTLLSLETLDLDDCSIHELSEEIIRLENLKLLSLKLCEIERSNPFDVIGRCLSLEELYFKDNKLCILDSINEPEAIPRSRTFPTLNRYHLQGGEDSLSKCVCLPHIDVVVSDATFKYLIKGAQILHLEGIMGKWRNLIPEIVPMEDEGMNDLVELSLECCSNIECIINTKHIESHVPSVFSGLVELKLRKMDNLEELCSGPLPSEFLMNLKRLCIENCKYLQGILLKSKLNLCHLISMELYGCRKVKSLFQLSTARSLLLLEELRIRKCFSLTNIIVDDNDHESYAITFPKLKILEVESCFSLECILPVVFPRDVPLLETIKIVDCDKLKQMFCEEQDAVPDLLQKVELSRCSNLFNFSIETVKRTSPRIGFKAIKKNPGNHNKLRSGSSIKMSLKDGPADIPISQISDSACLNPVERAQCVPEQSRRGLNTLVVRNIKQLVLTDLHGIAYLFNLSTASSMVLEILKIDRCHDLMHIIDIGDGRDSKNWHFVFPKLRELSVLNCNKLECMLGEYPLDHQNYNQIHIHLPALEKLRIRMSSNLSFSSVTWPPLKEFMSDEHPKLFSNSICDMMVGTAMMVSTTIKDMKEIDNLFLTLETLHLENYEVSSIFNLNGFEIIGHVRLGLQYLKLRNLFYMSYICEGSNNLFILQNLKTLRLIGCEKLQVIFPASVVSCLPKLECLEVNGCKELKQIIEEDLEDKKFANHDSLQACFPKLVVLSVYKCPELRSLISSSSDVPNLEVLILVRANELEELIEGDQRQGNVSIGKVKVVLPKLNILIFGELPRLCIEGNELQTVRHRVVSDCPKLSLTSTDRHEIKEKLFELDKDMDTTLLSWLSWHLKHSVVFNKDWESAPSLYEDIGSIEEHNHIDDGIKLDDSSISSPNLTRQQIEEEYEKEFVGVPDSEIPASTTTATSPTVPEWIGRPSPTLSDIPPNIHELVGGQSINEQCLMNQQKKSLEDSETTFEIPQREIKLTEIEISTDKESKGRPINIQDFRGDDLVSEDNLVVKVLATLEESLEMPLKDIAYSEANSHLLLKALKFLSHIPLEDVDLPDGLKAMIASMHKEFPGILGSFKQVFATINKLAVLESHLNEVSAKLVSKVSDAKKKEAALKEHIIRLGKQIEDCGAELSSLEEEQKKCIAQIIGYEKEYENVKKDRMKMLEDQRKYLKELFEMEYRWSDLCSQFELNRITARNPS
ncbi:hypothetical protein RIF29_26786 [Crotalaria pallida]|uniref:NB-ARC domain-containing protein n=1 Tax=Crotalaria pallida TaxID=3830 RepID=A0AAN9EVC7_CROPI